MHKEPKRKNASSTPAQANLARDNHFIPQMYQQGWSNDGKIIWEYKTLVHDERYPAWQHRSIVRTGVQKNLYVRLLDGIEHDDFEHMFSERFESPAMDALKRVREGTPLLEGDQMLLSRFICAQHVRTPGFYFASQEVNRPYIEAALKETIEEISSEKRKPRANEVNTDMQKTDAKLNELVPVSMTLVDYDEDHVGVKFEATIGKGAWLFEIQHHLDDNSILMQALCSYTWSIVDAPEGVVWPTCDRPLVLGVFLPDGGTTCVYGLNEAHILLFPISSKKLLATCTKEQLPLQFTASAEGARLFREMIVKNAFLYIYSSYEDDEIQKIRPRVINSKEATRIANELGAWYDIYNEQEAPLLGRDPKITDQRKAKEQQTHTL